VLKGGKKGTAYSSQFWGKNQDVTNKINQSIKKGGENK